MYAKFQHDPSIGLNLITQLIILTKIKTINLQLYVQELNFIQVFTNEAN